MRPSLKSTPIPALVALVLLLGTLVATTSADAGAVARLSAPRVCSAAQLAELRAAGDRFAAACELPGLSLSGMDEPVPSVRAGEIDKSANISLIGRVPLTGPFAGAEAFGTDMAFKGRYAYLGNYEGFGVYDIENPAKPRLLRQVVCPGSQNDISVFGRLLVLSVDSSRSNSGCKNTAQSATMKSSWEGIRVFDISRPAKPRFIRSVETACGSHTHTLAPGRRGVNLFVYVSSYSPSEDRPDCQPPHDFVSVVKIPLKNAFRSAVVAKPVLFPDGGNTGGYSSATSGCHDLTAYPAKNLMAGACMGDGILIDIRSRTKPKVISRVRDQVNFSFWHSATFNNAGTKVVFTDELGGGTAPTCNPAIGPMKGADGIYDIVSRKLEFRSYYKIPRTEGLTENCVAHNGSLIPVKGRDIMVQAWYQGGTSVFDFTDSANPVEIAHFDRGAISETEMALGGSWSSYWYNGRIYSSDITRGLEVFLLKDARTNSALKVKQDVFNAQSQPSYNG